MDTPLNELSLPLLVTKMIAVKTHISIDLPQSVSISGVVINLSLQARTTDDQCCNFTPSISP